jgi:hypothetical protein
MEAANQSETSQEVEDRGREVLRGIAKRRLQRRGRRAVRGLEKRARAFGRGARLVYAIQENPARTAAAAFFIGCVAGALWLGLSQELADLETEDQSGEGEEVGREAEAA